MVNPGVDDYRVNGKYSKKCKKTTTCWKPIKRIL